MRFTAKKLINGKVYTVEATTKKGIEWLIGTLGWMIVNDAKMDRAAKNHMNYLSSMGSKVSIECAPPSNKSGIALVWYVVYPSIGGSNGLMNFDLVRHVTFLAGIGATDYYECKLCEKVFDAHEFATTNNIQEHNCTQTQN